MRDRLTFERKRRLGNFHRHEQLLDQLTPAGESATRGQAASLPAAKQSNTPAADEPRSGRWIDVDVTQFTVRLMDGQNATMTISPVAVGAQIDTGIYNSTATGLFHVCSKTAALTYDPPYDTYISNWVGFDPNLDNGFHSFLEDANGKVVDASTGRVSNGCIRTGESSAIYSFAQIGMPVFVHA
jgi:L,D-transpeptidase catalytic domain